MLHVPKVYCCNRRVAEAEALFETLRERGVARTSTFNAMMDGYLRNGQVDRALALFEQGKTEERVNAKTAAVLLRGFTRFLGRAEQAIELFADFEQQHQQHQQQQHDARKPILSTSACNSMLYILKVTGRKERALKLFAQMEKNRMADAASVEIISSWVTALSLFIPLLCVCVNVSSYHWWVRYKLPAAYLYDHAPAPIVRELPPPSSLSSCLFDL